MAGKAGKKQAQSNLAVLNNLYKLVAPIVALSLLRLWLSNGLGFGHLFKFGALHAPLAGCCYVLDKSGRPQYDSKGKIVKEGMDLSQAGGLTEYMFDVIYLSLFGDVGQILFNTRRFWYVLAIVPIYAGYKLYNLKNQIMGSNKAPGGMQSSEPAADEKSKRQLKREKRGDKVKTKYR